MTEGAGNSRLQPGGISGTRQHLRIVIELQQQRITRGQRRDQMLCRVSDIGQYTELATTIRDGVLHWLARIMRHGVRMHRQIAQREGSREAFSGRVSLGSAGLGAILEGPLRSKRGSWIFSGKRSFIDAFTKDIGLGGVPVNYNFNTKVLYDLTERDRIWFVNISGVDKIRLGRTDKKNTDPDRSPELNLLDIRYNGWRSASGFNWQQLFGTRGVGLMGVTNSEADVSQTVKDLFKYGPASGTAAEVIARNKK